MKRVGGHNKYCSLWGGVSLGCFGGERDENEVFPGKGNRQVAKRKPGKTESRGVFVHFFAPSRTCVRGADKRKI